MELLDLLLTLLLFFFCFFVLFFGAFHSSSAEANIPILSDSVYIFFSLSSFD